jgi:hypothetical protein
MAGPALMINILYTTTAVAGVCLIALICISLKLRKVLITLTVLQSSTVKQAHATTFPSFIYKNPKTTVAPSVYFWDNLNIELEHVIISLEVCIFLLVVALFICICKFTTNKTQLACEITNGSSCVHIPLKDLSLCPTYWKIDIPQSIANITIQGLLAPILTFQWDNFTITYTLTEQTMYIQTKFKVNTLYARKLKQIMASPYCVYFYILHKGLLIPIK